MSEKPTPSMEAVTAFAEAYHQRMSLAYPPQYHVPSWSELTDQQREAMRAEALPILTATYRQITADVLTHYADQIVCTDVWEYRAASWLRSQAAEVLS